MKLPEVTISEYKGIRYLHLGSPWVQGSMNLKKPFEIDLEYIQRMMAWLLFIDDLDSLSEKHSMQLGLGSGTLTKFHYKSLKMKTTAIELNPKVIDVCRTWFKLPFDDKKLQVITADVGDEIKNERWHNSVDALQVDLYDEEAQAPVLDSLNFYKNCQKLLIKNGIISVNLFGDSCNFDKSLNKIIQIFGKENICQFNPTKEGNTIILAKNTQNSTSISLKKLINNKEYLRIKAIELQNRFNLITKNWLKQIKF